MARPLKEINKKTFENLCGIQCTKEEICAVLDVTDKTLDGWCKREYGSSFSDIFKQKRKIGHVSLRRMQFELAKKSTAMGIWLGKNYLGQRDTPVVTETFSGQDDPLSTAIRESLYAIEKAD